MSEFENKEEKEKEKEDIQGHHHPRFQERRWLRRRISRGRSIYFAKIC